MMGKKIIVLLPIVALVSCSTGSSQSRSQEPVEAAGSRYQPNIAGRIIGPSNYQPEKPEKLAFTSPNLDIRLVARKFVPGDAIYFEMIPKKGVSNPELRVNKKLVFLTPRKWGYRGIFTIHPEYPDKTVTLEVFPDKVNRTQPVKFTFELEPKEFPESKTSLDVGTFSRTDLAPKPEIQERIKNEYAEKTSVFTSLNPDHLGGIFAHPRDTHIPSSAFYKKRIYEQYEIRNGRKRQLAPRISFHKGYDFVGRPGDTVYAIAPGEIRIARDLYFEGNSVWIDHGNKIVSIYMHMSKLNVNKGDLVRAGHLIGFVGSTGVSTGPHLHVSLYIDSVPTDPMSLIILPVRH